VVALATVEPFVVASRVQLRRANSRDSATRVRSHSSSATILKSPSRVITSEAWRTGSPLCPLVNVILRAAMPQPVCSPSLFLSLSYLVTCIYSVFLTVRAFYLSLSLFSSPLSLSILFCSCSRTLRASLPLPQLSRASHRPLPPLSSRSLCRFVRLTHTHAYTAISEVVCLPTFRSPSPSLPPHCALYLLYPPSVSLSPALFSSFKARVVF